MLHSYMHHFLHVLFLELLLLFFILHSLLLFPGQAHQLLLILLLFLEFLLLEFLKSPSDNDVPTTSSFLSFSSFNLSSSNRDRSFSFWFLTFADIFRLAILSNRYSVKDVSSAASLSFEFTLRWKTNRKWYGLYQESISIRHPRFYCCESAFWSVRCTVAIVF